MDEERGEKKKLAIVKQIFKWVGLGIVTVLLIAGVIFQAPWKVITLLLVILLACTVLPKPMRKWFWLSVGVVVIVLVIWVFLPEGNGDWRPYTFDEELAALEAKCAIPDEENAALIYNKLLEDYDPNAMRIDFLDDELEYLTCSEPWSSKEYPQLAEWLGQHESTIAELLRASKIEKCRFPIYADLVNWHKSYRRFATMRDWARLLVRAANNDFAEGRIDKAIQKNLILVAMGKHLCQQTTVIEWLVGIAIEDLATGPLNRFIVTEDLREEHLYIIEKALEETEYNWSSDLPKFLEYEKLVEKNTLCILAFEINPNGKTRLSRDQFASLRVKFLKDVPVLTYWRKKLLKAKVILHWLSMPATPKRCGEIVDSAFEDFYKMGEPDFDWNRQPRKQAKWPRLNYPYIARLLAGMSEEFYYKIHDGYLRVSAYKRGSLLLVALRRYKNKHSQWPESLDDIKELTTAENFIDPINGGSFVYKLTDENFTLYSKGKNNIDEGGQWDVEVDRDTFERKVKADDRSIWPSPYERRKHREENIDG